MPIETRWPNVTYYTDPYTRISNLSLSLCLKGLTPNSQDLQLIRILSFARIFLPTVAGAKFKMSTAAQAFSGNMKAGALCFRDCISVCVTGV